MAEGMDDKLQKQLVRQLKILNFWITFFGSFILIGLIVIGFLMFRVIFFVRDMNERVNNFQNSASEVLDVKSKLCESEGGVTGFLKNSSGVCD